MSDTGKFDLKSLLEESVKVHGHLCPGQVLGVRMSMLGLSSIGIADPKGSDRKSLIVFVEMDRCATDAVQSVTGCSLGKRSMKFMDFGKMAATFYNINSGKAVRVLAREEARDLALDLFLDTPGKPGKKDKYAVQLEAYKIMPDKDLFDTMPVKISLKPEDMPGRPLSRVRCIKCGEHVQDRREISTPVGTVCKSCDGQGYYELEEPFILGTAMQNPHNDEGVANED